jgi:hypothetical protein
MRYPGESATGDVPGRRGSPSGRSAPTRPGPAQTEQSTHRDPSVFAPGYSSGRASRRESGRAAARAGAGYYGSTGGAASKGPVRGFPPAPGQPPPLYPPGQFSAWNRTSRPGGDALDGPGPASGYWPDLSSAAGSVATAQADAGTANQAYPGLSGTDLGDPGQHATARRRAGRDDAYPGYGADLGYEGQRPADAGYSDRGYADSGYEEPEYSALAVSDPAADVTSTQTWGAVDDSSAASGWSSPAATGWDAPPTSGWGSPGAGSWSDLSGPLTDPRRAGLPHTGPHQVPLPPTEPEPDAVLPGAGYGADRVAADPAAGSFAAESFAAESFAAGDLLAGNGQQAGRAGGGVTVPPPGWTHDGQEAAPPGWEPGADPDDAGSEPRTGPYPRTGSHPRAAERAGGDPGRGRRGATGSAPRPAGRAGPDAGPAGPPDRSPGTRGRGSRGRVRPRTQRRSGVTMIVSVLAVLVVAGAGGYLWFSTHSSPTAAVSPQQAAAPETTPGAAASSATSPGPWGDIVSRASDPAPLTLTELFPAEFTNGAAIYAKTVQQARPRCPGALIGSQLISAVKKAGCSQAMRASYLSSDQKLMGTIGVLNLNTATAAGKAGKAVGPSEFIAQLPAKTGPTKKLAKGTGLEAAEVKGHYLVLVWAEFSNLKAPRSPAQRQDLETFIGLLIQKTANVSLATRMVTGKPPT